MALARSTDEVTDKIAKWSALYDSRFSKTVPSIETARKAATAEVKHAKAAFTTHLFALIEAIVSQETRLESLVDIVVGAVRSSASTKYMIRNTVRSEIKHIMKTVDKSHVATRTFKGRARDAVEEHRRSAKGARKQLLAAATAAIA